MKLLKVLTVAGLMILSIPAFARVTLRYHNGDSSNYTFDVKIAGSSRSVTFESSRTSTVTIQSGGSTAEITTPSGKVTVNSGDNIEIKNGRIKVN